MDVAAQLFSDDSSLNFKISGALFPERSTLSRQLRFLGHLSQRLKSTRKICMDFLCPSKCTVTSALHVDAWHYLFGISPLSSWFALFCIFPFLLLVIFWLIHNFIRTQSFWSVPPCLSIHIKITCCIIWAPELRALGCSQTCVCFCVHVCECLCVSEGRTDAPTASGLVFSFWLQRDLLFMLLRCCLAQNNTGGGMRGTEGQTAGLLTEESVDKLWHGKTLRCWLLVHSLITVGKHYHSKCGIITISM